MAQTKVGPPLVRRGGGWWSAVAPAVVIAIGAGRAHASARPPVHVSPIIVPGLGVPDEPDGPIQGGMLKPIARPQVTANGFGTPRPPALTPQQLRLLKVRRIGR